MEKLTLRLRHCREFIKSTESFVNLIRKRKEPDRGVLKSTIFLLALPQSIFSTLQEYIHTTY